MWSRIFGTHTSDEIQSLLDVEQQESSLEQGLYEQQESSLEQGLYKQPYISTQECEFTLAQRITVFITCFILGSLCNILSTLYIPIIALNPSKFAVPFTFGNILSLIGSFFLLGPFQQVKSIFSRRDRGISFAVLLCSISFTIFAAFYLKLTIVCLLSIILQFCAFFWYSMTFIPWGHDICKSLVCNICAIFF